MEHAAPLGGVAQQRPSQKKWNKEHCLPGIGPLSGSMVSSHLLSGIATKSPNFLFTTKMIFPKSSTSRNSGSESCFCARVCVCVFSLGGGGGGA